MTARTWFAHRSADGAARPMPYTVQPPSWYGWACIAARAVTDVLPRLRGRWSEGPEGGLAPAPSVRFADSSPVNRGAHRGVKWTAMARQVERTDVLPRLRGRWPEGSERP
jgi:hypothetical protein